MDVGVDTVHICELEPGTQVNTVRYRTGTEDTHRVMVCAAIMVVQQYLTVLLQRHFEEYSFLTCPVKSEVIHGYKL